MAGFGFSIGDFLAVGQFAWKVYKSCRRAGSEFASIARDVGHLQSVLRELEEEVDDTASLLTRATDFQKSHLKDVLESCNQDLKDLDKILTKFISLKGKEGRWRDKIGFDVKKQTQMREKISSRADHLTLFLTNLHTNSLARIETANQNHQSAFDEIKAKLESIHKEIMEGKRDPEVLDSLRKLSFLEKELVDDHISETDVEQNKEKIKDWLKKVKEEYSETLSHPADEKNSDSETEIIITTQPKASPSDQRRGDLDVDDEEEDDEEEDEEFSALEETSDYDDADNWPQPSHGHPQNAMVLKPRSRRDSVLSSPVYHHHHGRMHAYDPYFPQLRSPERAFPHAFGVNYPPRIQFPPPNIPALELSLQLTLEELYSGCTREHTLQVMRFQGMYGNFLREEVTLQIPVKPGSKVGQGIKLSDAGDEVGGRRQDVVFWIEEVPHKKFQRDGNDLRRTIKISLRAALCGWEKRVRTIDSESVTCKHGGPTPADFERRFAGLGMPDMENPEKKGDFIVVVKIEMPETLTLDQQKRLKRILAS